MVEMTIRVTGRLKQAEPDSGTITLSACGRVHGRCALTKTGNTSLPEVSPVQSPCSRGHLGGESREQRFQVRLADAADKRFSRRVRWRTDAPSIASLL